MPLLRVANEAHRLEAWVFYQDYSDHRVRGHAADTADSWIRSGTKKTGRKRESSRMNLNFARPMLLGMLLALGASLNPSLSQAQENDPDVPPFAKPVNRLFSKEEFMTRRADGAGLKRGIDRDTPLDPMLRQNAIVTMQAQQTRMLSTPAAAGGISLTAAWTEIGPNPIPNGQVVAGAQTAASGRTIAIAVHPTNANLVYVGTAQGGLYRSTDGGSTWTAMMDNALSLAIGAVVIAPSQPDTIFVGTGESGFSVDSFFGVGIYRIDNASSASPVLTGPLGGAQFAGRSVSKIVVHPTLPSTIFVTTASGIGGIGSANASVLPDRGVFRSTDALTAAPTFTKLTVAGLAAQNRSFLDMVIDPGDPNLLLVTEADSFNLGEGGVYRSIDALAATPTFARTFTAGVGTNLSRTELALHRSIGGVVTVYAASGFNGGTVQRSVDGGATWTQTIDNNFCSPQCFYDIAIAVDPTSAATVYLGGSPTLAFGRSIDSGVSFTTNATTGNGLHGDSHAIAVAPSLPTTIYFGSDGGIYKSTNSGTTWTALNNSTFKATQFMSIAVHPIDPNFTIGGTQDNGTNIYEPAATWRRADFGDGGYAVIDQSAVNTTSVNMYHTYFNDANLQGYGFVSTTASATETNWTFRGCNGGVAGNGIVCGAQVLFYAPLEQGPGTPNSIYYGSNILYRSGDTGLNHTAVSQDLTTAISAIGISRQNDNVRIVGQANGGLFGTTTGSTTLTNLDSLNAVPNNFIARAVIDPNNVNTAYVTLSAFAVANVWRTTNLNAVNPTWTALVGTGGNVLPQVPVSAFLVDPVISTTLYAGTDIGVYVSTDCGINWMPFGTGLPRVAVFDMAKTSGGLIRIATHGRGMWQTPAVGSVSAPCILATTATLVSENFAPNNGGIDPGETVTMAFGAQNIGSANTVNDVGTLQATGGVTAAGAAQNYGVVVAAGATVSRNFSFTADPALACGASITATVAHVDGATNLGNSTYTIATGVVGATTTTSYTGPSVAIPDNNATGVNIVLPVSGVVGRISDLNFRLDALAGCSNLSTNSDPSVTHTFMGDLVFKLTSPGGTTVNLITRRGDLGNNFCTILLDDDGGFPAASTMPNTGAVAGNFAPETALSAFDGQNANGTWTLNVADLGPADIGTLNRFSLIITGRTCTPPPLPDLTISKTHVGNFAQGQVGASYTATVANSGTAAKASASPVTVTDVPPSGLTVTAMSGSGWTCTAPSCTRTDVLAAAASYPPITITVTVAPAAAASLSNVVNVSTAATEASTGNNSATNPTTIVAGTPGSLSVSKAGSGSGGVASQDGGINCGATCALAYVNSSNILLTATPTGGSAFTGWLGACTGTGTCAVTINGASAVRATFAPTPLATRILDIDANVLYRPESDGVLLLRYLFGLTGTALTNGALGASPTRTGDPQMSTYLTDMLPFFDVDGNGRVEASTDGLMIVRKLLGLTGTAITNGAVGTGATRPVANIEAYIQTLKPP